MASARKAPGFTVEGEGGKVGGIGLASASLLAGFPFLRHAFTLRTGGVSISPYDTLNLGLGSGDNGESVGVNRERAWQAVGLPREPLFPRQVHGSEVVVLDEGNREALLAGPPLADAVVTRLVGAPLGVLTADCVPVILVDRRTPALGVAHAGWRGTVLNVTWKAALMMIEVFGSNPADMAADIGPCISGECYEVGEDVREAFIKGLPYGADVLRPSSNGKWLADLREANRRQLLDARIPGDAVSVCAWCTHCETEMFYSARKTGGKTGRMAAVAVLA
jgi:hypothetical protein